jgi:uncharacterized MnhB-related membrane protein
VGITGSIAPTECLKLYTFDKKIIKAVCSTSVCVVQEQLYPCAMHNSVLGMWYSVVYYIKGPTVSNIFFFSIK